MPRFRLKSLEPSEIQMVLDSIPMSSLASMRNRVLCQLAWECALRPGEAVRIRNSHINIAERRLYVPPFKYSPARHVFWETDLLTVLLTTYRQKLKGKGINSEWLFPSLHRNAGKPLSYRALADSFDGYVKLSGLTEDRRPTLHSLRHSRLNFLRIERKADLRQLQTIAGHRSSRSTECYTEVSEKEIRVIMRGS